MRPRFFLRPASPVRLAVLLSVLPALAGLATGSCTQPAPPTVVAVIGTDIPRTTLSQIRVRAARSYDPIDADSPDITYDIGSSMAQVNLPQSIGLEPTATNPVIVIIDNSDSSLPDDPNNPPTLRRVVRVSYQPAGGEVLVFLHHNCLATVRPTSSPGCPGGMPNCTVSQWCEAQHMTCGNDGCCRSVDLQSHDIVARDSPIDASPSTPAPGESCGVTMVDGGPMDAGPEGGTDAAIDVPHG